jgi:hypothetical protein
MVASQSGFGTLGEKARNKEKKFLTNTKIKLKIL